ncbi:UNVERIFIED_CONTAM: hypothetical protein Sradi_5260200 [Sesamum radiatum]|uniref:Uncharacterized protein n=1 Tax=Sesamum radiatum TaxID=300843 RepID=A0AAW2LMM8_SESRA
MPENAQEGTDYKEEVNSMATQPEDNYFPPPPLQRGVYNEDYFLLPPSKGDMHEDNYFPPPPPKGMLPRKEKA